MSNANPTKARQAKKARRKGKPGTLEDARRLMWRALTRADELLDTESEDPETGEVRPDNALALKAIHAISQGASAYAKIVEAGELEARIKALEDAAEGNPEGAGPRLGKGAA